MSFFKASKEEKDIKNAGSKHITKSGIYSVNILAGIVNVHPDEDKEGIVVDMFVDHDGQEQTIYGNLRIQNNDGKPNEIGSRTFNQLLVISELDNVSDPVDMELPIGKKGKNKTVAVLEQLMDIPVLIQVQLEYGSYKGNFTEKKNIRSFYRTSDNASAEEIVNDKNFGGSFKKSEEYFDTIIYKDLANEENIKEWIKAKRPKGTAGGSKKGSGTAKKANPSFGNKRFNNEEK